MPSYYMPAEFKPHLGCILIYPHLGSTWRGVDGDCRYAKEAFRNVARAIAEEGQEEVHMFCVSPQAAVELRKDLEREGSKPGSCAINVHVEESNDSWGRDTGPTFVVDRSSSTPNLAGISWHFNAYGGKEGGIYWSCDKDKDLAERITARLTPIYKSQLSITKLDRKDLVLEGGAIHTDGEGTMLTTEQCLIEGHRNPGFTKEKYEEIFKQQLGIKKVIWLKRGLYMDLVTNGHIDNMACFVRPGHVLLAWPHDLKDKEQLDRSEEALLCPSPMFYTQEDVDTFEVNDDYPPRTVGERMAASYVNFYISNKA